MNMMHKDVIPQVLAKRLHVKDATTRIAVVGASNDPAKYGNVIVKNLSQKGYTVLPVNPKEAAIAGTEAYADLGVVPRPVHVVDFVTPPVVTLQVLRQIDPASVDAVWFQDGSFDDAVLAEAERFTVAVHGACIMVATNWL